MPLESANNFEQLDKTWPLLGGPLAETGKHLAQIKKVIKTIFPGANGNGFDTPILATEDELDLTIGLTALIQPQITTSMSNGVIVSGILPYSGPFAQIPVNYQLCDGTNSTPNLTDKFIYGTATQGEIGQTGGSADAVLVGHTHTFNHGHTALIASDGVHDHDLTVFDGTNSVAVVGNRGLGGNTPEAATLPTLTAGDHDHVMSVDNKVVDTSTVGGSVLGANNPRYIRFAYIIRVA